MPLNDGFEVTANIAAATSEDIDITWTSNEPTPAIIQTIADGSSPTVVETGQYIANMAAQLKKLLVDVADIRTKLNS